MPNDLLKTIGDYLNPEDLLTLAGPLAGFKPTAGITAAMYAPSLNENEVEELDKLRAMRPPAAAPRETAQTPEMRDFVNRLKYEQFVGELRKQYGKHSDLMLQGIIKQAERDEEQAAKMRGPRATPPVAPAARHEMFAPAGKFRKYNGGGKVKAFKYAKELLDEPLYHGGNYQKGTTITKPLYVTPSQAMAQSFADPMRIRGATLQQLKPDVKNPAPERLVRAAARRYVPENERYFTPASAFDENLHDRAEIEAMIAELRRRGYDSAVAGDVGSGGNWRAMGDSLILFPGAKAYADGGMIEHTTPDMADGGRMLYTDSLDSYAKGGSVQRFGGGGKAGKTVQQMADELLTKGLKTPDLSRRGFMRLPDLGGPKESKLPIPAKDMERYQTEKTTVDPLSGSVEKVVEKVAQTPMSRRQMLQGALAQAAQRLLPSVAMQPVKDVASEVAKTVMKPIPTPSIGGLVAQALKMGMDEDEIIRFVQSAMPKEDPEAIAGDLYYLPGIMRDPYEYAEDMGDAPLMKIFGQLVSPYQESPMGLRRTMRDIRAIDPEKYNELKSVARDIKMSNLED